MSKAKPSVEAIEYITPLYPADIAERYAVPCSLEEVERHVRAFIVSFLLPDTHARLQEFLIEKRSEWDVKPHTPRSIKFGTKARGLLRDALVNENLCSRISTAQRTPSDYAKIFGTSTGVYFHLHNPPCLITAVEADARYSGLNDSAILSFEAGKKALFFRHDYGVWVCQKQ